MQHFKEVLMKDKVFGIFQRVGRSFMLPIAILPVAGILLGIGQSFTNETMLRTYGLMKIMGPGTALYAVLRVCGDCGNVVFNNLPLIFAIGVAIAAMIIIAAPTHPIRFGMLISGNTPGAQLPSIVF